MVDLLRTGIQCRAAKGLEHHVSTYATATFVQIEPTHDQVIRAALATGQDTAQRIAAAQRAFVAEAADASLAGLGFAVYRSSGATTLLWAERAHQVLALEVHDGGGFALDLAGLRDGQCQHVIRDFTEAMAGRGVSFTSNQRPHNDPDGGALIRRIRKADLTRGTARARGSAPIRAEGIA